MPAIGLAGLALEPGKQCRHGQRRATELGGQFVKALALCDAFTLVQLGAARLPLDPGQGVAQWRVQQQFACIGRAAQIEAGGIRLGWVALDVQGQPPAPESFTRGGAALGSGATGQQDRRDQARQHRVAA